MKRYIWKLILATAGITTLALAQGPNGPGNSPGNGPGSAQRVNAGINITQQQIVEGTISSVHIDYGAQYPSIVVNQKQIKVAPAWYLLENDFELAVGDAVSVAAAPSNAGNDPYLYAISITKAVSGVKITLRDAAGLPLWAVASRRGGNPQAPRTGSGCVDAASIKTVTGTIERVTIGAGIQHPELVLKTADGLLTVELGPERIILGSDLELKPGSTLTVRYALATCEDEAVALQLTDSAGNTVLLRHDNGMPAWFD